MLRLTLPKCLLRQRALVERSNRETESVGNLGIAFSHLHLDTLGGDAFCGTGHGSVGFGERDRAVR